MLKETETEKTIDFVVTFLIIGSHSIGEVAAPLGWLFVQFHFVTNYP